MVSGSNKRRTKKKGKQKLVLAKDKNQAIAAIAVICLFFANSLFMIVRHAIKQHAISSAAVKSNIAMDLMEDQQQNLEDFAVDPMLQNPDSPKTDSSMAKDANDIYSETLSLKSKSQPPVKEQPKVQSEVKPKKTPLVADNDIEIIAKKSNKLSISSRLNFARKRGKMVLISVTDFGRSNPFSPIGGNISTTPILKKIKIVNDNNLLAPPKTLPIGTTASRVMGTTISGILYDKYSPSAIINIEGAEYLVKINDEINRYKILDIGKDKVIVQLGNNVYKAGVGELLSQTNINYNIIANLNKKFGGNEIQVNVKKKGY